MTGDDDDDRSETELPPLDERDVVDASSEEGQRRAQRNRKRRERREREFIQSMLADDRGREFLWGLVQKGFETPFACGPTGFPQPEATWFKAGASADALGLYHRLLAADFEGTRLMLAEHDSRFKKAAK